MDATHAISLGRWLQGWRGAALLFLLTLGVYLPAILYGGFIWDDEKHILTHKMLYDDDALRRIWLSLEFQQYYPIQLTTYWLELKIAGQAAWLFHLDNVLFHALAGILLWRVLEHLKAPWAWLAAAFFLLHPVNVESAAWITERRNVLCAVFYFGTLLCWLRFEIARQRRWYLAMLACGVCALLSKSVACSLPVVILMLSWMSGKTGVGWNRLFRDGLRVLPLIIIGLPLGLLTAGMERYLIGASGYEWNFTIAERLLICGQAFWFYLACLFWPVDLIFIYPRWTLDSSSVTQWSFFVATVVAFGLVCWIGFFRRRKGTENEKLAHRRFVTPLFYFALTLFPALGFANIYPQRFSFVANHFQYIATVGICVFAVGVLRWISFRIFPKITYAPAIVSGLLLGVCCVQSFQETRLYKSNSVMWADVLKKNPTSWLALTSVGAEAYTRKDYGEAIRLYRLALEYGPRPLDTEVSFKLGNALSKMGLFDEARAVYTKAVDESPAFEMVAKAAQPTTSLPLLARVVRAIGFYTTPQSASIESSFLPIYQRHRVLGTEDLLIELAKIERNPALALEYLKRAERLRPHSVDAALKREPIALIVHVNLGHVLLKTPEWRSAQNHFDIAFKMAPNNAEVVLGLGVLQAQFGYLEDATELLKMALKNDPTLVDAYLNLSRVLNARRLFSDSVQVLQTGLKSVTKDGEHSQLADELAWLYSTCPDESVRRQEDGLSLALENVIGGAKSARVLDTLAAAYANNAKYDLAVETAIQAQKQALAESNPELAQAIAGRLALYQTKKPYRQGN